MSGFTISPARRALQLWFPIAVIFALIFVELVWNGFSVMATLDVSLVFVPIFFIARHHEGPVAPIAVLALGVLKDLTSETPLGFWALLFCVFFILSVTQRHFLQTATFKTLWVTYGLLSFLVYALFYFVSLGMSSMIADFGVSMVSALLTVLCFPIINLAFLWFIPDDMHSGVN
jgi:hypothetical protein